MAEFGFLIKKFIGAVLMPLPICLVIALLSLYFFYRRQNRQGTKYAVIAFFTLVAFSTPITSSLLIKPLEFAYPKLPLEDELYLAELNPEFIVVMGCWHSDDKLLPLVAQIHRCSLPRVVQAAQMWHQLKEVKLVFSGTGVSESEKQRGKISDPQINAKLALSLGVDEASIILIEGAKDSAEEIQEQKRIIEGTKTVVISSATHISRLKLIYNTHGLDPIFSPAEYTSSNGNFSWRLFLPSSRALEQSERAIYEYMGLAWVKLKIWVS